MKKSGSYKNILAFILIISMIGSVIAGCSKNKTINSKVSNKKNVIETQRYGKSGLLDKQNNESKEGNLISYKIK